MRAIILGITLLATTVLGADPTAQEKPQTDPPPKQQPVGGGGGTVGKTGSTPSGGSAEKAAPSAPPSLPVPAALASPAHPNAGLVVVPPVTVTGCVTQLQADAAASVGSRSSKDIRFILDNIADTSFAITTAAKPAPATAGELRRWLVLEGGRFDLREHVGHQVELTGTMTQPVKSGDPASSAADATIFRIQSLKMLSATCSTR